MANKQMGLIGRKVGMTQFFEDDGDVVAVTVIEAGPCTVLQVKTEDSKDGYNAIQIGFGERKASKNNKPLSGHVNKAGADKTPSLISEIRLTKDEVANYSVGQVLSASDVFSTADTVDVTGTSKGKGFAGVMKRYNFKGFIRTHGTHEFFRHGGSIGTRLTPGHVFKGKKMPGHMGAEQKTIQNLRVARVDSERSLVFVRGGVPGPNGGYVKLRKAVKA
jgi:large subunit ribosomal protein L3